MEENSFTNEPKVKISFEETAKGFFQMKVTAYGVNAIEAAANADEAVKLAREVMQKNGMPEVGVQ